MDPRVLQPRDEDYWYVLNIWDVGEYTWKGVDEMVMGDKPNRIVFTTARCDSSATPMPKEMRIESLAMGYLPKEIVDKLVPVSTLAVPKLSGNKLTTGGYTLTVNPSGAMAIDAATRPMPCVFPTRILERRRSSFIGSRGKTLRILIGR